MGIRLIFALLLWSIATIASTDVQSRPIKVTEALVKSFDVQCVLSDVDGTLLTKQQKISDVTLAAIKETIEKGYPFYPCTGRTRSSAISALGPEFVALYGTRARAEDIPGVFQQGLTVYGKGGKLIYEHCLQHDSIKRIVDFCDRVQVDVLGYAGEKIYCKKRSPQTDKIVAYSDPLPIEVPAGLPTLQDRGINIQKMILVDESDVLDKLRPLIQSELSDVIDVTLAVPGMLELLPIGTSKGFGVDILLKHFQIPAENVMAFGDGENDVEMMRLVKYSIAMENAYQTLKDASSYFTGHVNENGVAEVLRYLSNKV
jgi:Cof subfamily protein (haloacid dehalogenase superfamily)